MEPVSEKEATAARLRLALEMAEAGIDLKRQNLRREDPAASDEEIERRLNRWLAERPGAEHGDVAGKPIEWPRKG